MKVNISPHLIIINLQIVYLMQRQKVKKQLLNLIALQKDADLDEQIKTLTAKPELKTEKDKIEKLQKYVSSLFVGQHYFFNDGGQIYLIFNRFMIL